MADICVVSQATGADFFNVDVKPFPTVKRIVDTCMAIDAFAKAHPLKPPKIVSHIALMRHFRECILGKAKPIIGPGEGVMLMQMIEAIYRSSERGKSVEIKYVMQ